MKTATHDDATRIGQFLNVDNKTIWEIIKGMTYQSKSELYLAIHHAFRSTPADVHRMREPKDHLNQ